MRHARLTTVAVIATLLAFAAPAYAALFSFDPDGAGGANAPSSVLGLDWLPGNAVAIGGAPLTPASVGTTFTVLYQAKLGSTAPPTTITGLNTTFEITVVAEFLAVVDAVSLLANTSTILFSAAPNQTSSFVEIYYDDLTDASGGAANDLTGIGFSDGTLILSGKALSGSGFNFTSFLDNVVLLDQAGADNRGGQLTVTGTGSGVLKTSVLSLDSSFFLTPFNQTELDITLADPFGQVDPSLTFFNGDPRAYTPSLGQKNGISGPDFQWQTDSVQLFVADAVPGPGTMILTATGLAVLSRYVLRRRHRHPEPPLVTSIADRCTG